MAATTEKLRNLIYMAAVAARYGNDQEAADCIWRAMVAMQPDPSPTVQKQQAALAAFADRLCERLADRESYDLAPIQPDPDAVMILASQLYVAGGHTALIDSFVRAHKTRRVTLVVTTYGGNETELDKVLWKYPALRADNVNIVVNIETLNAGRGFPGLVGDLLHLFRTTRPADIYMFTHPQDVAATTAIAALNRQRPPDPKVSFLSRSVAVHFPRVFFYHHADIRATLGLTLKGCIYLANKHAMVEAHRHNAAFGKHYIPLTPPVVDVPPPDLTEDQTRRLKKAGFVSVSIGNRMKFFPPFAYPIRYPEIVARLLERPDSVHVHIGVLYPADVLAVRDSLRLHGIDPERFLTVAFYPSLALFLQTFRTDLFVCSFPIGGGMSLIEALSQGCAILAHRQSCEAFSELVYCPPEVMVWETPAGLTALLAKVDRAALAKQKKLVLRHFEAEFSFAVFERTLLIITGTRARIKAESARPAPKLSEAELVWLKHVVAQSFSETLSGGRQKDAESALAEGHLPQMPLSVYFDDDYYRLFVLLPLTGGTDDLWQDHPILHYLREGMAQGASPHPLLDAGWLMVQQGLPKGSDILRWYIDRPATDGCQPHPLFDGALYLSRSTDVREAGIDPLRHYLEFGYAEIGGSRVFCALFDRGMFAQLCHRPALRQPDLLFYLFHPDAAEKTHTIFSPVFYRQISRIPAADRALLHYFRTGMARGLDFNILISNDFIQSRYGLRLDSAKQLRAFLTEWDRAGVPVQPHPLFDPGFVLARYPHLRAELEHPVVQYLAGKAGEQPHPEFQPQKLKTRPQWESGNISTVESFARQGFRYRLQLPESHPLAEAVNLQLVRAIKTADTEMVDALTSTPTRFPHAKSGTRHFVNRMIADWSMTGEATETFPAMAPETLSPAFFDKPHSLAWTHFQTHTTRNNHQPMHVVRSRNVRVIGGYAGTIDADGDRITLPAIPNIMQPPPWRGQTGILRSDDKVWCAYADTGAAAIACGVLLRLQGIAQQSWALDLIPQLIAAIATDLPPEAQILVDESLDPLGMEAITALANRPVTVLREGHVYPVDCLIEITPPIAYQNADIRLPGGDCNSYLNIAALTGARQALTTLLPATLPQGSGRPDMLLSTSGNVAWVENWRDVQFLFGSMGFDTHLLQDRCLKDVAADIAAARNIVLAEHQLTGLALMFAQPGTVVHVISNLAPGMDHNSLANIAVLFGLKLIWLPCADLLVQPPGQDGAARAVLPAILHKAVLARNATQS